MPARFDPGRGVRYIAQEANSGYGEAADRVVHALRAAGVTVEYRAWSTATRDEHDPIRPHRRDELAHTVVAPDAPTIARLVPEHYPAVRAQLHGGPLVGSTVWETDRLPTHWPALLADVEHVVVPCTWNRDVFVASGVTTPIAVVPHIACDPQPGDEGASLPVPDDVIVFYTIGTWDARKAPWLAIEAFVRAFTADDPVALVVKTGPIRVGSQRDLAHVRTVIMMHVARLLASRPRPPRIVVEADDWPLERIAGLHTRGDCYVSLTHGEGWGLPAFDACAYGNPVVMTGWGGALAYLDPDRSWLVDTTLVPVVHDATVSYSPDQQWAEPDVDHAVTLLRGIAADLDAARARAMPLRDHVLTAYAPARVAPDYLAVLDRVAAR